MYIAFGFFLLSISITLTLIPFIIKVCKKLKILDFADLRKQKEEPKVRLGGLAITIAYLISIISTNFFFKEYLPLNPFGDIFLIGSLSFFLIGFLDDIFIVSPLIRLLFQISFSIFIWSKGIRIENISFSLLPNLSLFIENFEILSLIITVIWIVGIVNALNWLDGLDSLATGISSITFFAFMIIFYLNNMYNFAFITLIIFASCIGFLFYNLPPAKILMGDGGSYFLGFNLAIMSLLVNTTYVNNIQIIYFDKAVLMLFVPLVDMTSVICTRLLKNKSPFYPDRSHIHHRILDSGVGYNKTLIIIFMLTLIFILLGIKI